MAGSPARHPEAAANVVRDGADANRWLQAFASAQGLDRKMLRMLTDATTAVTLPSDYTVFEAGAACRAYTLIRSGTVRVHQLDQGGGEILLYRLGPGDTCVLNTAALLAEDAYAAYATTETEVQALSLSLGGFRTLMATSEGFRSFVFRSHAARIAALMQVVGAVAFERIDVRLAKRLLALAADGTEIAITHARLAAELGTAREVVSRNLEAFERCGTVALARGGIAIVDRQALSTLAKRA